MNAQPLLSDLLVQLPPSLPVDAMLAELETSVDSTSFFERACRTLYEHLVRAPEPSFCLLDALRYLRRVEEKFPIDEGFALAHFEIWLNAQPEIDRDAQLRIRAKIAGKWLPRSAYQVYFPIGLGNAFAGSHIVTAHSSPDLDTCVASFWGWVDAFAAKVGEQLHSWNLPGGTIAAQDRWIFDRLFGAGFFALLAKSRSELTLNALDLFDREGMALAHGDQLITELGEARRARLIVLIDEEGLYCGDWRAEEGEAIDQVIAPLRACLHYLESQMQTHLIAWIGREVTLVAFEESLQALWALPCEKMPPILLASPDHKEQLQRFLQNVLGHSTGLDTTLGQLKTAARAQGFDPFYSFELALEDLKRVLTHLEQPRGDVSANVTKLPEVMRALKAAIADATKPLQRLDMQVRIKERVLELPPAAISARASIEEVRHKLQEKEKLVVIYRQVAGKAIPLGVIDEKHVQKTTLGSVSQRDFCNRTEVQIPPYLQVISTLDHHRAEITTSSVPTCTVADVQSCNVLLAEAALTLNERYGSMGLAQKQWESQWQGALASWTQTPSPRALRRLRQLLKNPHTAGRGNATWYVHPHREIAECLCMVHAIFDDTDLLEKVTPRDARCAMHLLNRLKSLQCQEDVEIVDDDELDEGASSYARDLARRILQHPDTHSLYSQVYKHRAESVETAMRQAVEGVNANWFADTKEQGSCARVGQSKLLPQNIGTFLELGCTLRGIWVRTAASICANSPNLNLHLYMCSTISGAEETYLDKRAEELPHRDQLWLYCAMNDEGKEHLRLFLGGIAQSRELREQELQVEINNDPTHALEQLFKKYFPSADFCIKKIETCEQATAVLYFRPGSLNSRKVSIAPYLPNAVDPARWH